MISLQNTDEHISTRPSDASNRHRQWRSHLGYPLLVWPKLSIERACRPKSPGDFGLVDHLLNEEVLHGAWHSANILSQHVGHHLLHYTRWTLLSQMQIFELNQHEPGSIWQKCNMRGRGRFVHDLSPILAFLVRRKSLIAVFQVYMSMPESV